MELYVTEISKYVIDAFMLIYCIEAFMTFRFKTEKKRRGIYIRQIICMFVVQISCFIQIFYVVFLFPLLFMFLEKRAGEAQGNAMAGGGQSR